MLNCTQVGYLGQFSRGLRPLIQVVVTLTEDQSS